MVSLIRLSFRKVGGEGEKGKGNVGGFGRLIASNLKISLGGDCRDSQLSVFLPGNKPLGSLKSGLSHTGFYSLSFSHRPCAHMRERSCRPRQEQHERICLPKKQNKSCGLPRFSGQ